MLNIDEINNTIQELENGDTTFATCQKLASLYVVRKNYPLQPENNVVSELYDILPQYREYCEVKKKYQLQEVTAEKVTSSMRKLCIEVEEFLHTLYSHTDMEEERQLLYQLVERIKF